MNKPKNLHPPNKAKERKCVNSVLGKLICIHVQYANKIARERARARKHTHAPYVNKPKSIISHLILYLKYLYVPHTHEKAIFFQYRCRCCWWWCLFGCVSHRFVFYICSFANFSSSESECCCCCYYWCFSLGCFSIAFSSWLFRMIFAAVNCYCLHSAAPIPVISTQTANTTTTSRRLADKAP